MCRYVEAYMRQQPPFVDEFLTVSIPHTQVMMMMMMMMVMMMMMMMMMIMMMIAASGERSVPPHARRQDAALRRHVPTRGGR